VLAVVLLPQPLEALAAEHPARDLHRADGVVAVDPPHLSYAAQSRLPAEIADALATLQARRLLRALDAPVGAVALFDPRAYPLARGLLAIAQCELWYARAVPEQEGSQRLRRRLRTLDEQARDRSTLRFTTTEPLWERMRELGVDVRVSRR
jgi:pimeloyl-ACP methyl ester carboxylesterase